MTAESKRKEQNRLLKGRRFSVTEIVTGYLGTAAEDYAAAHGFEFNYLDIINAGDLKMTGL